MVWIEDIVWVNWVWGRVGGRVVVGLTMILDVRVGERISPPPHILPPIHSIHPQTYNISLPYQSHLSPHQNPHQTLTILDNLYHSFRRRNTKVLLRILFLKRLIKLLNLPEIVIIKQIVIKWKKQIMIK